MYIGGADEALLAGGGKMRLVLKDRMGFVASAVETGAPLVPALAFGENSLFRQHFAKWLRKVQLKMGEKLPGGFSLPVFRNDKWYKGLLPNKIQTYTVFGEPLRWAAAHHDDDEEPIYRHAVSPPVGGASSAAAIDRRKDPQLFRETVQRVHSDYIEALKELHARWKHLGPAEDQELEILTVEEARKISIIDELLQGREEMDELKRRGEYASKVDWRELEGEWVQPRSKL